MDWYEKLSSWGYPRAGELAPILESLGFNPEAYTSPYQLGRDLGSMVESGQLVVPLSWWDPIKWFFGWLWETIKPWAVDIGLILLGGVITTITSGWYKAIGAVPIIIAVYRIMKRTGVIE